MAVKKGTIRFLKRQIESKMVLSESGRYFLPESYLSVIFTLKDIEKAVSELDCAAHDRLGLARKIYEEGTRIFAILVKNGEEDSIIAFREHDVLDARLPLNEALATRILNQLGTAFALEYQWQFLPYKFRRHMRDYHRHISDSGWILPFVGDYEVVASGGFGDIFKVNVFPSQHEFPLNESGYVQIIRKRLRIQKNQSKEAYDKAFRNEQRCLILLNQLNHPNIVPLLASYTYRREHNFLFPAYEMDLEGFFKRGDRFGDFRWSFTFHSALRGLAAALCSTHKLHLVERKHGLDLDTIGYHHDLRPANVLISQETFVLADFGLGKLKSKDSLSQTQWKVGNGDYVAPECMDENFAHQEVGRAIDVWAFGCLVVEVATYIEQSAAGLEEFRKLRISRSRQDLWEESCFHDTTGSVKTAVRKWLALLMDNNSLATPTAMLINLSSKALKKEPKDRPQIADICGELTLISLKAHFLALRHVFHRYLERSATPKKGQRLAGMKVWFERERFLAFGRILGLDSDQVAPIPSGELSTHYDKAQRTMVTLYRKLEYELDRMDSDELGDSDSIGEESIHIRTFENDVYELVGFLWNLLSPTEERKAENAWLRAMLNIEDVELLDNIGHTFGSEDDSMYEKGAAIAMMKKVRLEILSNPTSVPPDFIISAKDVQVLESVDGHDIGLFKRKVPVLIEWMYYTLAWKDIPPEQHTIVMGLKAQSFGLKSKPPSLRTLDCIGTFEKTGKRIGYGFVYRLPVSEQEAELAASTTTLHQIFAQSYRNPRQHQHRPLLGDKFRLASMLASFLREFHSIGWLHENLNSNNILFFNNKKSDESSHLPSQTLEQPYIVGLHKSRPGGKAWHTEGPTSGAKFQDYQHPEYVRTKRFRLEYDYYSFGLVLLEIGFWRPLWAWSKQERCQKMNLAEFRQELVENYVPRLGAEMGTVYRDVVQFCLSTSDSAVNDEISDGSSYSGDPDGDAFKLFTENATERLEELARRSI